MNQGETMFFIILATFALVTLVVAAIAALYWLTHITRIERDLANLNEDYIATRLIFDANSNDRNYDSALQAWQKSLDIKGDALQDIGEKRQEFWSKFIQFCLSIVVVGLIAILMLLKIVTAEAGLPILAAIGGAAVGQGASSISRNAPRPNTPPLRPVAPRESR